MTRINTIDVKLLTDQHLMAEYRELPMVNASLRRSKASKKGLRINELPKQYTLNKGHVSFFYDKGKWLLDRYTQLINELRARGYDIKPHDRIVDWSVFDAYLWRDWTPRLQDQLVNLDRILIRIGEKEEFYRMRGKKITLNDYKDILGVSNEI